MRATSPQMRSAAAYSLVSFTKSLKADFLQKSLSVIVTAGPYPASSIWNIKFIAVLSLLSRDNLRALPGPADVIHTRQLVCYALRSGMSSVLDEVGQLGTFDSCSRC